MLTESHHRLVIFAAYLNSGTFCSFFLGSKYGIFTLDILKEVLAICSARKHRKATKKVSQN